MFPQDSSNVPTQSLLFTAILGTSYSHFTNEEIGMVYMTVFQQTDAISLRSSQLELTVDPHERTAGREWDPHLSHTAQSVISNSALVTRDLERGPRV